MSRPGSLSGVGRSAGRSRRAAQHGRVHYALGAKHAALDAFRNFTALRREIGDGRWLEADILHQLALFLDEMGRTADAIMALEQSVTVAEEIDHVELQLYRAKLAAWARTTRAIQLNPRVAAIKSSALQGKRYGGRAVSNVC